MLLPRPLLRASVLTGFLLGGALPAWAQLSSNSPFTNAQAAAAAAPQQQNPIEFAGYLTTKDGIMYVVRDPVKKASTFLKLNERDSAFGVVVKQHDVSQNTLTIEYQGRPMTLEVKKAKIASSGNMPMVPMPAPMPAPMPQPVTANVAPAVTQTVVVNPTAADEQKRLEAVAAEVARRRALREQASQQMSQGGAAQPAPANNAPQQAPAVRR